MGADELEPPIASGIDTGDEKLVAESHSTLAQTKRFYSTHQPF